ncbi:MAG: RimK family alpha-L-glutamate ligase [Tepidisphaera sp.]|nr:RimK family alpha-L-glutamate ligase [Tepidisphaera sp.]
MGILLVLDKPEDWPLNVEGVEVVPARKYLTDTAYSERKPHKVFNLCKSYRYQSIGYYVSLLASARGHKPLPDISTIQDLKLHELVRVAGEELDEVIQEGLKEISGGEFTLSIYFGKNVEARFNRLALAIFNRYPAPFLRASFEKKDGEWRLEGLRTIPSSEIPSDHFLDVLTFATQYFNRPHRRPKQAEARYDMAILRSEDDPTPPSNEKAIKKFVKAGEAMGFDVEIIGKDDYGRLGEFDALFIRDTTNVLSHTFRFARRADAEGLVVIDDPESIVRCSNKVYLAELLQRHRVATPPTLIVHKDNAASVPQILGLPLVLKQPDSSFSLGVIKAKTREEYEREIDRLLKISDLVVAQAYMPTDFDWRVGVLDGEPYYVCKYFMVKGHWQIYDNTKQGDDKLGEFETWPVDACPPEVLKAARRVADLIGDGLYGVDIKEVGGKAYVIEINDNPNIDAGVEDKILGDEIYAKLMRVMLGRLEGRGR